MICSDNAPVNKALMVGRYAPDFELPGIDGEVHHLARYLERYQAIAIVFLSGACPTVAQALPQLLQLQAEFGDQGFTCIGISANSTTQVPADGLDAMKTFAEQQGITFPYIRDVTQDVAQAFGVVCTPEVFLLDAESRVRYQGRIAYGTGTSANGNRSAEASSAALREALSDLLKGQSPRIESTTPEGTKIFWR